MSLGSVRHGDVVILISVAFIAKIKAAKRYTLNKFASSTPGTPVQRDERSASRGRGESSGSRNTSHASSKPSSSVRHKDGKQKGRSSDTESQEDEEEDCSSGSEEDEHGYKPGSRTVARAGATDSL